MQIIRHLADLIRREPDDILIARAQDRADIEVVEVTENAFLCHAQDTGQHSEFEVVVALERVS